jgi:RNA 2',3'-cyclic 3'-phosphodiesterase
MPRLRTFIAVDVNKAIRDRAVALQASLARAGAEVKWVEPENFHVTLLFLGEVDNRDVIDVCRAVADVCERHEPFSLTVETVGCFPNARRPRVVWVGITDGAEELGALHDALEPPLLDLGCYRREERRYTPHFTIGRVQAEGAVDPLSAALAKQAAWHGGTTQVSEVLVMSSELRSPGPQYTVLSRAKLG